MPIPGLPAAPSPLIDTNVSLGTWPFRRVPGDTPSELVARLRGQQVEQAWVGSLDGLFHRDLAAVNARLADDCRRHGDGWFVPFGSINPLLPDWEEDLRRCHEEHRMPGIRLHPNYHGYKLDDPLFARVLDDATKRGRLVQLVVSMEDERTQPRLAQVPHVDLAPLTELVKARPQLRLMVLNAFRGSSIDKIAPLVAAGRVWADVAMLESVGGVEKLAAKISYERVVFGSHFPLFYWESARLKLQESRLDESQFKRIARENAKQALAG
ncbi:MAG TPA: amidohydrolase family protein [Pirellulaceae bacterium]|nr:amidohydrolase family protein [Pirellulaceae bacterium]